MKSVDLETKSLLGKLYNLRGKESNIILKMNNEKNLAEETKVRTEAEKEELTKLIDNYNKEELLLTNEGGNLKDALNKVVDDKFLLVLNKLNIDFEPVELYKSVEAQLPISLNDLKSSRDTASNKLELIEREMNDAITLIDEIALRKEEALANQSKLNDYFDLAFDGNINITRDAITTLLSKFELNDEEQREAAKLLMFPEDGLFQYDEELKDSQKSGKSFSDVFAEAKAQDEIVVSTKIADVITEDTNDKSEIVTEDVVVLPELVVPEIKVFPTVNLDDVEQSHPLVDEIVVSEEPIKSKMDVKLLLTNAGFNILDFGPNDITFIEDNAEEELFKNNIEVIKNLGINNDIFLDNIELFIDDELKSKIDILLGVGKVPFDIYLNPNVLVKYDVNELKNSIESLKESGLDPKKVPLMAY